MRQGSPSPHSPTTRAGLKLFCLVEQAPDGRILCLPVHTHYRPQAPWAPVSHKWTRVLPAGRAPPPPAPRRWNAAADSIGPMRWGHAQGFMTGSRLCGGLLRGACERERIDVAEEFGVGR